MEQPGFHQVFRSCAAVTWELAIPACDLAGCDATPASSCDFFIGSCFRRSGSDLEPLNHVAGRSSPTEGRMLASEGC